MRQTTASPKGKTAAPLTELELRNSDSEGVSEQQHASNSPDPFYDEHADSEDERWVARNLLHVPSTSTTQTSRQENPIVNNTTQSVSCPSCFAILSMQTQQHLRFKGQFRAVFVSNCETVKSQRLRVKGDQQGDAHVYQPVSCSRCHTEVGVRDQEGVYHFCNVMY